MGRQIVLWMALEHCMRAWQSRRCRSTWVQGWPLACSHRTHMSALELEGPGTKHVDDVPTMHHKLLPTILVNLAAVLEKCEEQILPAVYSFIGASFGASPTELGYITLCRALTQALAAPLGGIAGHYLHRGKVLGVGCLLWASSTSAFTLCSSLTFGKAVWAVNGLGLALVIPTTQSLTADYFAAGSRGRAFGTLWLTASLGGMAGALFATNMGSHRPLGMDGWRFAFLIVSAASALTGALNIAFTHDPRRPHKGEQQQREDCYRDLPSMRSLCGEVLSVVRVPTFLLIVAQGIAGSIPWSALVFMTLYLQLLGMSDAAASSLVALFFFGIALGGLLGGWVGDFVAAKWQHHGRIAATQFSVATGIPFALLLLKGLPQDGQPSTVALYAAVLLVGALLKAWPAPCCNNPLFAEIVPPGQRNLVYAFDRCFEGAIASCAAPLVGVLADKVFGFSGSGTVTGNRAVDLANARALGNALLGFMLVPWVITLLLYTGLHFTYPRDRVRALQHAKQPTSEAPPPAGPVDGWLEEEQPLQNAESLASAGVEFDCVDYDFQPVAVQRMFPEWEGPHRRAGGHGLQ